MRDRERVDIPLRNCLLIGELIGKAELVLIRVELLRPHVLLRIELLRVLPLRCIEHR